VDQKLGNYHSQKTEVSKLAENQAVLEKQIMNLSGMNRERQDDKDSLVMLLPHIY
jgi:hypothetical protein